MSREVLPLIARCLAYPDEDLATAATAVCDRVRAPSAAAGPLGQFADAVTAAHLDRLREVYTRTFDLQPSCVPYLGVHLFGEESSKRARLLTGLAEAYARDGHRCRGELPDHVAVVLGWAPRAPDEEWDEIERLCLAGPVRDMAAALAGSDNPYRYLLEGLRLLLGVGPAPADRRGASCRTAAHAGGACRGCEVADA